MLFIFNSFYFLHALQYPFDSDDGDDQEVMEAILYRAIDYAAHLSIMAEDCLTQVRHTRAPANALISY